MEGNKPKANKVLRTTVYVWATNLTQNQASILTGKLPEVGLFVYVFFPSCLEFDVSCTWLWNQNHWWRQILKRGTGRAWSYHLAIPQRSYTFPTTFMLYWWFHNGHPRIQNQREYMSIIGFNLPSLSKLLTLKALEKWLLFCFTFQLIVLGMVTN